MAADSIDIALEALRLIEVDYEVLPAALTPREAMKPDAPLVPVLDVERPREGNVQQPVYLRERGDLERGFAEADAVSESRFRLPTQYHVDIQTRCCVADWDGERLTVHEASQGVWNVKRELAKSLGLGEEQVRVVVKHMGGGFGSKAGAQRVVHYAARLAMLAGRPVRLELTRPEEFLSHPRRYAAEVTMRLGARRDGALTAIDADIVLDIGSGSLYAGRYALTLHQIGELYQCDNVRVRIRAVYTNTGPTGPAARRARPHRHVLHRERDGRPRRPARPRSPRAPHEELRRAVPGLRRGDGAACRTRPSGSTSAWPPWPRRSAGPGATRRATPRAAGASRRGIGIAAYCIERGGYAPFSAKADVVARPDGSVELQAGVVEIGAGQTTILPMIAAEELGIDPARIHIHHGDTDGTHYAPSSHASRITSEMGPAVLQAAALVRQRLFELVGAAARGLAPRPGRRRRPHPRARRGEPRHGVRGGVRPDRGRRAPRHREPRAQSGRRDLPRLRRPRRRGGGGRRDGRGARAAPRRLPRHRARHQSRSSSSRSSRAAP